jgi:hypothetical protein
MNANRIIYTKKTIPPSNNVEYYTPLEFGMHKGKTPEELIRAGNEQYLKWLFFNNINIKFCTTLKKKLNLKAV